MHRISVLNSLSASVILASYMLPTPSASFAEFATILIWVVALLSVVGREGLFLSGPDYVSSLFYPVSVCDSYGFPGSCWHNLGKPVSSCIWIVADVLMTAVLTHNAREEDYPHLLCRRIAVGTLA